MVSRNSQGYQIKNSICCYSCCDVLPPRFFFWRGIPLYIVLYYFLFEWVKFLFSTTSNIKPALTRNFIKRVSDFLCRSADLQVKIIRHRVLKHFWLRPPEIFISLCSMRITFNPIYYKSLDFFKGVFRSEFWLFFYECIVYHWFPVHISWNVC